MFDNNTNEYPFFCYNYSLYPSREQQLYFLRNYVEEFEAFESKNVGIKKEYIDEEKLLKEISYFTLLSHMYWGTWAVLQPNLVKNFKFKFLVNKVLSFIRLH